MPTQDGKNAPSYASNPAAGLKILTAERSACHHEFDIFQLDRYISLKEEIATGNDTRVRELCESMHGITLEKLKVKVRSCEWVKVFVKITNMIVKVMNQGQGHDQGKGHGHYTR